jgi:hypothetical protein
MLLVVSNCICLLLVTAALSVRVELRLRQSLLHNRNFNQFSALGLLFY